MNGGYCVTCPVPLQRKEGALFAALRTAGGVRLLCSSVSVPGPARSLSVGIGAGIGEIITDTDTKPIPVVSADTRYTILVSVSAYLKLKRKIQKNCKYVSAGQ